MTTAIKAVAWDIDGTLIDSEPLHDAILCAVCANYGVDLRNFPIDRFHGVHIDDVWLALKEHLAQHIERDVWINQISDTYVQRSTALTGFPDVLPVMRTLADTGIRQVCVSNSGRKIVNANLAAIGVDDLLDFSISLNDVHEGKPAPEPYLQAATRLALRPEQIAAIEDSPTGARAAHAAGMRVFGIGNAPIPFTEATVSSRQALLSYLILARGGSTLRGSTYGLQNYA